LEGQRTSSDPQQVGAGSRDLGTGLGKRVGASADLAVVSAVGHSGAEASSDHGLQN